MSKIVKKIFVLLFFMLLIISISGCKKEEKVFNTLDDFNNAKIGVMTGSVYDDIAKEKFPNSEREYYTILTDLFLAVEQRKIDGFITELPYYAAAKWEGAKARRIEGTILQTNAGYILPKSEDSNELLQQLNEFISKSASNGLMEELKNKWFSDVEPTEFFDLDTLDGKNGTLKIAVSPDLKPYIFLKDNKNTGYEIEMLGLFAKEYGYDLDIDYMTFDAILPSIVSEMYDIGVGGFTITEERQESVNFSISHATVDVIMVTYDENAEDESFWENIKDGFIKTFIRENRWQLILKGMGITILISVCSIIIGSLLGFGLYLISRIDNKVIRKINNGFTKVYTRIIDGTPVVVILMILFYVVFGKLPNISGIIVSIIGFALIFGAFVYKHMIVSVNSVDYGQTEAAYALGYPKNKAFFRVLLPQSMPIFLPTYCGQVVELIKATAVVGYIAVTDLTKMGDIIRSNTYEAFFPLITTAIIYFILTWILSSLLNIVRKKFDAKYRKNLKILKGVKLSD